MNNEMIGRLIGIAVLLIGVILLPYGSFAFILLEPDVGEWTTEHRAGLVATVMFLLATWLVLSRRG